VIGIPSSGERLGLDPLPKQAPHSLSLEEILKGAQYVDVTYDSDDLPGIGADHGPADSANALLSAALDVCYQRAGVRGPPAVAWRLVGLGHPVRGLCPGNAC
jgi:hypothetical protein